MRTKRIYWEIKGFVYIKPDINACPAQDQRIIDAEFAGKRVRIRDDIDHIIPNCFMVSSAQGKDRTVYGGVIALLDGIEDAALQQ